MKKFDVKFEMGGEYVVTVQCEDQYKAFQEAADHMKKQFNVNDLKIVDVKIQEKRD